MSRFEGLREIGRQAVKLIVEEGQTELDRVASRLKAQQASDEATRDLACAAARCQTWDEFIACPEMREAWKAARHAARLKDPNQMIPFTPEETDDERPEQSDAPNPDDR